MEENRWINTFPWGILRKGNPNKLDRGFKFGTDIENNLRLVYKCKQSLICKTSVRWFEPIRLKINWNVLREGDNRQLKVDKKFRRKKIWKY